MSDTIFSDLSINRGKINTNEEAIFQSIINLLNTKKGERFFNPVYGGEMENMVFRLITNADIVYFRTIIEANILKFEPRILKVDINVKEKYDDNSVLLEMTLHTDFGQIAKSIVFNSN